MGKKRGRKNTRLPMGKYGKMYIIMAVRKHGKTTSAVQWMKRRRAN